MIFLLKLSYHWYFTTITTLPNLPRSHAHASRSSASSFFSSSHSSLSFPFAVNVNWFQIHFSNIEFPISSSQYGDKCPVVYLFIYHLSPYFELEMPCWRQFAKFPRSSHHITLSIHRLRGRNRAVARARTRARGLDCRGRSRRSLHLFGACAFGRLGVGASMRFQHVQLHSSCVFQHVHQSGERVIECVCEREREREREKFIDNQIRR